LGGKGYGNVRPLGLGNVAFDSYVIYFSVIVRALSLGVKVDIGTFGNCKDCAMGWEGFVLLLGLLGLWQRWGCWIGFIFYLGVIVLHWIGNLWNCWGICNLWRWRRVRNLWGWQMMWMVFCDVMVGLLVCRRWCLVCLVGLW
jgi:hypothetical protein